MSLRDQLLKAGIADKKKVREANQSLKRKRRKKQGKKQSHKEISRIVQSEQAERQEERRSQRKSNVEKNTRQETERRVTQLLSHHQIRPKPGPQTFRYRSPDAKTIGELRLAVGLAKDLRDGKLAIAWLGDTPSKAQIVLIPRDAAQIIIELEPPRILLLNDAQSTEPPMDEACFSEAPKLGQSPNAAPDMDEWMERAKRREALNRKLNPTK